MAANTPVYFNALPLKPAFIEIFPVAPKGANHSLVGKPSLYHIFFFFYTNNTLTYTNHSFGLVVGKITLAVG